MIVPALLVLGVVTADADYQLSLDAFLQNPTISAMSVAMETQTDRTVAQSLSHEINSMIQTFVMALPTDLVGGGNPSSEPASTSHATAASDTAKKTSTTESSLKPQKGTPLYFTDSTGPPANLPHQTATTMIGDPVVAPGPAQSTILGDPVVAPAQSTILGDPVVAPAQSTILGDPVVAPAQSTVIGDPVVAPAQSTAVGDPVVAPGHAQSTVIGDPVVAPGHAQSTVIGDPVVAPAPAQSTLLGDPAVAPAPAPAQSTLVGDPIVAPAPAQSTILGDPVVAPTPVAAPAQSTIVGNPVVAPGHAQSTVIGDPVAAPVQTTIVGDPVAAPAVTHTVIGNPVYVSQVVTHSVVGDPVYVVPTVTQTIIGPPVYVTATRGPVVVTETALNIVTEYSTVVVHRTVTVHANPPHIETAVVTDTSPLFRKEHAWLRAGPVNELEIPYRDSYGEISKRTVQDLESAELFKVQPNLFEDSDPELVRAVNTYTPITSFDSASLPPSSEETSVLKTDQEKSNKTSPVSSPNSEGDPPVIIPQLALSSSQAMQAMETAAPKIEPAVTASFTHLPHDTDSQPKSTLNSLPVQEAPPSIMSNQAPIALSFQPEGLTAILAMMAFTLL